LVDELNGIVTEKQQISLSGDLVVRGSTGQAARRTAS
ncbi:hypothetical protein, partial [Phytoactinopolyspora endophytica]